jgi:hypothetical protein
MAFCKPWIVEIFRERLVKKGILDPEFFKQEALPYSAVWIDANSSWQECGNAAPSQLCGRQKVSLFLADENLVK